MYQCRARGSNPDGAYAPAVFKTAASAIPPARRTASLCLIGVQRCESPATSSKGAAQDLLGVRRDVQLDEPDRQTRRVINANVLDIDAGTGGVREQARELAALVGHH